MRPAPIIVEARFRLGLFIGLLAAAGVLAAGIVGIGTRRDRALPAAAADFIDEDLPPMNASQLSYEKLLAQPKLELPGDLVPVSLPVFDRVPVETVRYHSTTYRYLKTLRLRVTAYAPDVRCTWPYRGDTTASGLPVWTNGGRLVAADNRLIPMYALVSVPGYGSGTPVPVLDRGGAIKGHRLDVLLPTYEKAKMWGTRVLDVKVYAPMH